MRKMFPSLWEIIFSLKEEISSKVRNPDDNSWRIKQRLHKNKKLMDVIFLQTSPLWHRIRFFPDYSLKFIHECMQKKLELLTKKGYFLFLKDIKKVILKQHLISVKISRKAVMLIMEKSMARHLENFSEMLNNPLRTLTFCKVKRYYLLHFRLASELKRILFSSTTWSFKMKKQTRIWKSRNICFPQIKWIRVGMKGWNLLVLKQCSWTSPKSSL